MILETKRLRLISPSIKSLPLYKAFYLDEEASKFYKGPLTEEEIWARLKADIGSWHMLGFGVWVIEQKEDNQPIGVCGFWQGYNWPTELTWWILPSARRKGFALEASQKAVEFAYNALGWKAVNTYMDDDNIAAQKLVNKLGGKKINRMLFPDEVERDIYLL